MKSDGRWVLKVLWVSIECIDALSESVGTAEKPTPSTAQHRSKL